MLVWLDSRGNGRFSNGAPAPSLGGLIGSHQPTPISLVQPW